MSNSPEDLIARIEEFMAARCGDMDLLVDARSKAAEATRTPAGPDKDRLIREAKKLLREALGIEDEH